ncbi:MAG: hypothetical protein R3D88_08940 [Alphaproteobacteria bacterium]|jgi:hypothetical protein
MPNFIHEYEPLNWLVSSLFTDEFHDYRSMLPSLFSLYGNESEDKYKNEDELYAAIDSFIIGHKDASNCLVKAKLAIKNGDISEPEKKTDEWGDPVGFERSGTVNSYEFYLWAESKSYQIPPNLMPLIKPIIQMAVSQKQYKDKINHLFPSISREQFDQKTKEPLWQLGNGILYLLGHRYRLDGNKHTPINGSPSVLDFINRSTDGKAILKYAMDAYKADQLDLTVSDNSELNDESLLAASVVPNKLTEWVKILPITAPIFSEDVSVPDIAYMTPDMKLMLDAVQALWSEYDLQNPDPSIAPFKKDVVKWLMDEAAKRNIQDFSKSRAEMMDTIIRCPKSRGGGNTL